MRAAFEKKLLNVHLRCEVNLVLVQLGRVLLAAGGAAALAVAVERAFSVGILNAYVLWALLSGAAFATWALWLLKRPSVMAVALLTDERLGFQERFSTALALGDSDDPFAKAAIGEAHEAAERIHLRGHFPIRPTRSWAYAVAVWALAGGLVLFMPSMDLLGYMRRSRTEQQRDKQLEQAKVDVKQAVTSVKTLVNQLGDAELTKELARLDDLDRSAKPQALRRQAIRKLGDLSEKVKGVQMDKQLDSARMMQRMMKDLRGSPKGLSRELTRALAKSNFAEAARLIKEWQEQLADGKLTEAQKKALSGQLKDLARQLEKLAQQNKELEDELQKAGLDKKLAKLSEDDLRKALKDAGMSDEQIKKLMEKMAASRTACNRMGMLGAAMGSCAGAGTLGGEELAALGDELDMLEAMMTDLAVSEAALEEIDDAIACLGQGDCWGDGYGSGMGMGEGQGYGVRPTDTEGQASFKKTRLKNKPKPGPIIASWYFKGPQVKGESKRQFTEVVQASRDRAAEAISDKRIPRKYEAPVKKYFGDLEELGEK